VKSSTHVPQFSKQKHFNPHSFGKGTLTRESFRLLLFFHYTFGEFISSEKIDKRHVESHLNWVLWMVENANEWIHVELRFDVKWNS